MRTGGGPCVVSQPSTSTLTQESMLIDEDALAEVTDVELTFAVDSDVIIPGIGLQVPTQEEGVEDLTEQACGQQTDGMDHSL